MPRAKLAKQPDRTIEGLSTACPTIADDFSGTDSRMPLTFADRNTVAPADLNGVRLVSDLRGLVQLPVAT
jgi:hypothetical protein